ncbi:n-alpha-acetyltransferase 50 [Anaeramoeba ignava]|uniref:N-alpha-acetyltransferase 60 n=1 Tax=Anaeramoeba ignava TaxID=1746090 RepID=A0A9Q0LDY3_ANAIG|nr:n-alpha-acetyltransferase 50 [Anaeramoeba ignava]
MKNYELDDFVLVDATKYTIEGLKLLDSLLFPIIYPEKHYENLLGKEYNCIIVIYWKTKKTFGIDEKFRKRGIGTKILKKAIEKIKKNEEIKEIVLHVKKTNINAISFYKKFGFKKKEVIENYYSINKSIYDGILMVFEI